MQFNVPNKCYEFKPNTDLFKMCKCYEMNIILLFLMKCCLDFVCQKIWITQEKKLIQHWNATPHSLMNSNILVYGKRRCRDG